MKVLLFANTDWYLFNYRLPLARALRARKYEVILLSPPGRYTHQFEDQGFQWRSFPLARKGTNPFLELVTIFRLARVFHRERPDIVHLFTIKPVLYGSIAARIIGVKKIVNSITGLGYIFSDAGSSLRKLIILLYRFSLSKTRVIFQNPEDHSFFVQNGLVSADRSFLIPGSGVDVDIFSPSPEPTGIPIIMLAGRLLRSKGIPEFITAARQIIAEGIQARFVIVGEPYLDNPDSIKLQELNSWQNEGIIEAWGWHDDMAAVISKSSIVCLPTTYKEGLPRLLLEAGACGRPVITTDIPGCRLVVRSGENGLLIPPGDIPALVKALKTLISNPILRRQMGVSGRKIVVTEFSVNQIVSQTLEVYNHG